MEVPSRRPALRPAVLAGGLLLSSLCAALAFAVPGDVWSEVVVEVAPGKGKAHRVTPDRLRTVLQRRAAILSEKTAFVKLDDAGRATIRVAEPSLDEAELKWLTRPGLLEVVWLPEIQTPKNPAGHLTFASYAIQDSVAFKFMDIRTQRFVPDEQALKGSRRVVTGDELEEKGASWSLFGPMPLLNLKFGPVGQRKLASFARAHAGGVLGVMLDGQLLGIPIAVAPRSEAVDSAGRVTHPPTPIEEGRLQLTPNIKDARERGWFLTVALSGSLPPLRMVGKPNTWIEEVPGAK